MHESYGFRVERYRLLLPFAGQIAASDSIDLLGIARDATLGWYSQVFGMSSPEPVLEEFLRSAGLVTGAERVRLSPLGGGVSSEIWRVDLPRRTLCIKRALPQLKGAAEWFAPVSRNGFEWAWLEFASRLAPAQVPEPIAHSDALGMFAMSYLDPQSYPIWKQELLQRRVSASFAGEVGALLAHLHAASAGDAALRQRFRTLAIFEAIRIEPYLLATARYHADLSPRLHALARCTTDQSRALVHGDVSPKNILMGASGPVFIDAECAWYGDPAFDLAFCMTHLLLKCLVHPDLVGSYLQAGAGMLSAYRSGITWETPDALEERAAALLPAFLLARVDGKSPVEYLVDSPEKQGLVREVARPLIAQAPLRIADVMHAWETAVCATYGRHATKE
jgi:Phosphotransferase enzyme family